MRMSQDKAKGDLPGGGLRTVTWVIGVLVALVFAGTAWITWQVWTFYAT
jgi:hypothetical protein